MPPLEKTEVDISGLRKLYRSNDCAKAILDYSATRLKNSYETSVDRFTSAINKNGGSFSRREVRDALRELGETNCGTFIIGRRGQASRFRWSVRMNAAGKAARGDQKEVEPLSEEEVGKGEAEEFDVPQGMIRHTYKLRADFAVVLDLPEDLKGREALRLADFIKTLPFEAADEADGR